MAVTVDATGGATTYSAAASGTWAHTVGGTANYLVVLSGSAVLSANRVVPTVNTNGPESLTNVTTHSNNTYGSSVTGDAHIFAKVSPTTGSRTVSIQWSTGSYFGGGNSISFIGVDTGAPTNNAQSGVNTAGTGNSLTGVANSGDIVVGVASNDSGGDMTLNQTSIFNKTGSYRASGQYATASTWVMNPTWGFSVRSAHAIVTVAQSAGGGSSGKPYYYYQQQGFG